MFKLSYQLLISRKKWLILLTIAFSLVISSVISIFTATDTIKLSLFNRSFQEYGEFSGVLYNISEKKEDIIKKVANVGCFVLIDSVSIENNKSARAGWVDPKFIDLGHIKLICGEFPTNPNEVAIESYYLESIDAKWKIGETRIIDIGNEPRTLKLVGIIDNYSSKWSVRTITFPNLFVSKEMVSLEDAEYSYLIGFNQQHSIEKNISNTEKLISEYHENGYINERLFFYGLKDIKKVMIISFAVQLIILLAASFSILSILSYFNTNQITKFAIFKVLGCTNKKLILITILQTIFIYIFGIILSIPLISIFHYQIIRKTYGYSLLENNIAKLLIGTFVWLILLFIMIIAVSYLKLRRRDRNSIYMDLRGVKSDSFVSSVDLNRINHFSIKQLMIQLLSKPKNTILSILTLTFSILVILLSFTMAKESAGIWNTKIDYFLTSQELIGTKVVNNMTVVITKGETFHPSEVKKIEILDGIKYVDKVPFMLDVFPLVEKRILPSSLISYIKSYNQDNYDSINYAVIPNVKYVLLSEEEISRLYYNISKEEIQNSIIIHIPNLTDNEKEQLIGENIILTKTYIDDKSYKTRNWDFKILDVIGEPYTIRLDGETITRNEITIIMNEDIAIEKQITNGYKDIVVYTDENISEEISNEIYNKVYSLTAGIPGSLFQYIPDVMNDYTRITDYLGFLGKLAFYISIILAILCIYVVIHGKYQLQRRYWGIYRALGMSINKVFLYLLTEVLVYFGLSVVLSFIFYLAFLFLTITDYPAIYYIGFAGITTISIFFMLIVASIFIKQRIQKDSISSLLRIVE